MKRTFLFLCAAVALHAADADFPLLRNTNSVNNGTEPPPLTAAEALAQMKSIPPGFKTSVFASEPDIQNSIQMAWDTRGPLVQRLFPRFYLQDINRNVPSGS